MCGLCGIVHFDGAPIDPLAAQRMLDALGHRGPDDEGSFWVRSGVSLFLGHRRLSIIDLSEAGRQPMSNENGTIAVLLNGEIYNFQALRAELEGRGHRFRSQTDTEVIAHLYEDEGPEGIARLDGMFALALWDDRARQLVLARDRPGKKPLYYYRNGPVMAFASEIPALLEWQGVDRRFNPRAVPLYLTYGYVPCPETFYACIRQLPPASYLVLRDGQIHGPVSYWGLAFPQAGEELRVDGGEAGRQIRTLLTEAVRKRLVADVPLGAFLSGGIDSSIVVALMSRLQDRPVKTFTIGFTGPGSYDERAYARLVAERYHTDHTEFVVKPDAVSLVDELLEHHGQPFGDSSAIPTYIVARLTRQHVTVALNGDGGDELFAGYERFLATCLAEAIPRPLARLGAGAAGVLPQGNGYGHLGSRAARFLRQAAKPLEARYLAWNSFIGQEALPRFLDTNGAEPVPLGFVSDSFAACLRETEGCDLLNRLLYLNYRTYLHDDVLVKMDRMTMAHGLEARSPFLDTALTEYVTALPPRMKIKRWTLKHILKAAFRDLLPPPILQRGKHGFGVPLGAWFAGDLREYVHDTLLAPDAAIRGILNQEAVRELYMQHLSGACDHGHQLWALMTLELWLRTQRSPSLSGSRGRIVQPVASPRI